MKVQLMFLVMSILLVSGLTEAKEAPMINEVGEVQLMEKPEVWRLLSDEETKALENPGQKIPIISHITSFKKVDFWYVIPVSEYNKVLIYQDDKIQTILENGTIDGQPILSFYVLFCLIAIGFMMISNLLMVFKNNNAFFAVFAAFAVFFAAFFAAFAVFFAVFAAAFAVFFAVSAVFFAVFAASAAVFAASAAVDIINAKVYWLLSLIFYVLIITAMFV